MLADQRMDFPGSPVILSAIGDVMSLIHNERTKLLANALDRVSTAFIAVGVLGQALSLPPAGDLWILAALAYI
jgi:hypothetical protein